MPMELLHMEKSWFAFLFNNGKLKGLSKLLSGAGNLKR